MVPSLNTGEDVVAGNIKATFERGYKAFAVPKFMHQGPVSIVGAGSSLSTTYKDLVGDVMACNSAHDFLIGKGIIPKYTMLWDAHPIISKVIDKPHKDVKYLIASRCHPSVFEKFKGFNVEVWHAMGGENIEQYLIERNLNEPMIAGGSSGVTRALFLAGVLGYNHDMHIFGACDANDGVTTHVGGSLVKQNMMDIRVCGKWWKLAPWMAMQAADFKTLVPILKAHGVRVIVHGKGFLPYTATFIEGVETPDIKVSLYEHARRAVHHAILAFLDMKKSPQLLGGSNARN